MLYVRKMINERPRTAAAAIGVFVIATVAYSAMTLKADGDSDLGPRRIFFSTDDGATYFADSFDKPRGFLRDGKPAYEVNVFSKGGGPPFVGFLRRQGQAAPVKATPTKSGGPNIPPPPPPANAGPSGMIDQIKRPGEKDWVGIDQPAAVKILAEYGPTAQKNGIEAVHP